MTKEPMYKEGDIVCWMYDCEDGVFYSELNYEYALRIIPIAYWRIKKLK